MVVLLKDHFENIGIKRNGYIEAILDFAREDSDPEVRAAAIYAIGTYIGCVGMDQSEPNIFRLVEHASAIAKLKNDACFLVRREIVYSIQLIIGSFLVLKYILILDKLMKAPMILVSCV